MRIYGNGNNRVNTENIRCNIERGVKLKFLNDDTDRCNSTQIRYCILFESRLKGILILNELSSPCLFNFSVKMIKLSKFN